MKELQAIVNALIDFYNKNIIGAVIKLVSDNACIVRFLECFLFEAINFIK